MARKVGDDEVRAARIDALTDGVYAIAMTLMVLNIDGPDLKDPKSASEMLAVLSGMWPRFFNYGLSFAILMSMWLRNNRINRRIEVVSKAFTLNSLLSLLFVCLLPFSVSLIGDFGDNEAAEAFFHLNLLALGLFTLHRFLHMRKNTHILKEEFKDDIDDLTLTQVLLMYIATPVLALAVAMFSPGYSTLCYLLLPIIGGSLAKSKRKLT